MVNLPCAARRYATPMWNSPARTATLGIVCVILFQWLIVQGMGGDWTVLFCSGSKFPPPPDLAGKIYQFPDSYGFDGQFYYYIARDFTDARNTSAYVDFPAMRWLRMLLPGAAAALALGDPDRVTYTYIGLMWTLCALGIWLMASICRQWGYPPLAGLSFLAIPAVLVSLDRMMTDLALVVALVALLWAVSRDRRGWAYVVLALAPLARETGLTLNLGWALYQAWRRDWKAVLLGCVTVVPFIAWLATVLTKFDGGGASYLGVPFAGIVRSLFTPGVTEASSIGHRVVAALDYAGIWGIAASLVLTPVLWFRGERSILIFCALAYMTGISFFTKADMWSEAYSYVRTGGPVALCLALIGAERHCWWLLAPMAAALPRVVLQILLVSRGALYGWLG